MIMHHILLMCSYTCIIQNDLTDLCILVNNKISQVCKSEVTSHGNVMSHENATSHENAKSHTIVTSHGNSLSHLVEISQHISWKLLLPLHTLTFYMQNIARCHTCPCM